MGTGRSLLILGEPGSGKTKTLLELARDLLQEAELDINQPIAVVFNLSAWTKEKLTIADWLVQELNTKYQVSKEIGKTWIKNQQLLLLLDGLDEVLSKLREMILRWRILVWGIFGLLFGVAVGGGEACVKHLILRMILYLNGYIPWNYARFLNYATERIFLQKVGGGYIFIHRLLLEHFAQKNCSFILGGNTFDKSQ